MVPVRGTVTFNGGPPPADGRIAFSPISPAAGKPSRPGSAGFSTDGEFSVSSFEAGDGLVPGTYRVKVSCLSGPLRETMTRAEIDKLSYVPRDFAPPELVIEPGSRAVTYDLDIPPVQGN